MKILFLTPWYPDEVSKHGVFVQEQARAISKLHTVLVVSTKINYKKFGVFKYTESEFVDDRLVEKRIRIYRSLRIFNQLNYFLTNVYLTLRVARNFQPDIIHGNIGYPGGFWSYLVSSLVGKPYLITEHTFIYNNFRSFLHKRMTLFALSKANRIVTVSTAAANEIKKFVRADVKVVPNIIRVDQFPISPFPSGVVTMGFMGNLSSPVHVKGLDTLLRALGELPFDFRLIIGGEGSRIGEYKAMARELGIETKCIFHGFFPYDRGHEFMNQIHFYINSSRHESFGIAIAESIASGRPVVCFDNGGPSDFVTPDCGLLIENQNETKLRAAILWMAENYHTYDQKKMRASVVSRFSEKAFQERIEKIYQEVSDRSL